MNCPNCDTVPPIPDQGTIRLETKNKAVRRQLEAIFAEQRWVFDRIGTSGDPLPLQYDSRDMLLRCLNVLMAALPESEQANIAVEIGSSRETGLHDATAAFRLDRFFALIKHHRLVQLIAGSSMTSHMQPIIDMNTMRVVAYEFLLRPATGMAFQPYELFQVAQQTGLHSFLDRSARISAIQTSAAHLARGVKRFINFLPSSIYNPNYCLSHTFAAISRFEQDPRDFVFEVVETEKIQDIAHLKRIFQVYKEHGIQVALDDVGSGYSTLDVLAELKPDYVKIDRDLIRHCDQDEHKQQMIADIVRCAQTFGAAVLAEGMERKEELACCKSMRVELAQGYLIGKPAPAPLDADSVSI